MVLKQLYKWEAKNPKSVLQIVHGSAEHAGRYEHFAKWLNKQGVTAWAMDLRGHGQLEAERGNLGYFGKKGHLSVLENVNEITLLMKKKYKDIPYALMGHSMGSFIVRATAMKYKNIDKLIIFGTNHQPKLISAAGHYICSLTSVFMPKHHKVKLLDKLSYKAFDKKFKNESSGAWISKNEKNKEMFANDKLSGFTFTNNGFKTMTHWVNSINSNKLIKNQNKNMKVLFLAGKEDPVGKMAKEVKKAYFKYVEYGIRSNIKLYEEMRHEILNETNKIIVYKDIYEFIKEKVDFVYNKSM